MTDTTAVRDWYNENAEGEHGRLELFGLEYAVSMRAISSSIGTIQQAVGRHTLQILDLGGGTGRYAVELARRGHNVHLSDISASELSRAKAYAAQEGVQLAGIVQADALYIDQHSDIFKPEAYDLILCQGPLYHLLEPWEREKVIKDCAMMLRREGYLFMAFVTKWAHLRDIVQRDPERVVRGEDKEFYDGYIGGGERSGRYDRFKGRIGWHVSGGREIRGLVENLEGDLKLEKLISCEGFLGGGLSADLSKKGIKVFERWVEIAAEMAEREEMWGAADHLLAIVKKS